MAAAELGGAARDLGRGPRRMTRTTCHMSISVDGFVAGPDQDRDNPVGVGGLRLHEWHWQAGQPGHDDQAVPALLRGSGEVDPADLGVELAVGVRDQILDLAVRQLQRLQVVAEVAVEVLDAVGRVDRGGARVDRGDPFALRLGPDVAEK